MKALFSTLVAIVISLIMSSCSLQDLAQIQPSKYEQQEFERQITRSVRRAVHAPGVDNGSTIIVTMTGDTLVAPKDTMLRAADIRTVYVDIQSPPYPKGLSRTTVEHLLAMATAGSIAGIVILILFGLFLIVVRRQNGRNKALRCAIEQSYPLPEAFYTGTPAAAPVTINNFSGNVSDSQGTQQRPSGSNETTGNGCPPPPPGEMPDPLSSLGNTVNRICGSTSSNRLRDLRNGFLFIGIGFMVFLGFVSGSNEMLAFLCGGSLIVLGIAKLLTIYFGRRF